MAINFPDSPTDGQMFTPVSGQTFVYGGGAWSRAPMTTALPKNYIVNGGMLISEQNVETAGTTSGYYCADQWQTHTAGIVFSTGRSTAIDGTRIYTVVTTGKVPAASEYLMFQQVIEGQRTLDLQWGTPNAKAAVIRFVTYSTVTGTYGFAIRCGAGSTPTFASSFVSPSTGWTLVTIPIPPCTIGTWPTDIAYGLVVDFTVAAGSSLIAPVNGWQAGNFLGGPGMTNNAATSGTTFYIREVGLHADPYQTGVAPLWDIPIYATELRKCQRYWYRSFGARGPASAATTTSRQSTIHPAPMRATPTCAIVGTPRCHDGVADATVTAISAVTANTMYLELNTTSAGNTMTGGKRGIQYNYQAHPTMNNNYIATSARMT